MLRSQPNSRHMHLRTCGAPLTGRSNSPDLRRTHHEFVPHRPAKPHLPTSTLTSRIRFGHALRVRHSAAKDDVMKRPHILRAGV
jgi:hypothetical protein